MGTFMGVQI